MKNYTLPKQIGEEWIKALRSGEYKQKRRSLCDIGYRNSYYCSLGLAGHLLGISDNMMLYGDYISKEMNPNVPDELDGQTELANTLSDLNDNEGYTFEQISDWIEENITMIWT